MVKKVITTIILAIVALFFVGYVTPEIEKIPTTDITNPIVLTFLTLAQWVIPVGAIVGVMFSVFVLFRSKAGGD